MSCVGAAEHYPTEHHVVEGDTLYDIAEVYLGDGSRFKEIAEANALQEPYSLEPGQRLLIPAVNEPSLVTPAVEGEADTVVAAEGFPTPNPRRGVQRVGLSRLPNQMPVFLIGMCLAAAFMTLVDVRLIRVFDQREASDDGAPWLSAVLTAGLSLLLLMGLLGWHVLAQPTYGLQQAVIYGLWVCQWLGGAVVLRAFGRVSARPAVAIASMQVLSRLAVLQLFLLLTAS